MVGPRHERFFRVAWLVVQKDITVEVRSFELLSTTLFFAVTVVLMFSFGLVVEGRAVHDVAPAILWIAIAFSGTLALGRTFERERQNDTLRALLLAPADRPAIYVGKLLGILLLLALVETRAGAAGGAAVSRRRSRGSPVLLAALLSPARSVSRGRHAVRGDAGARAQPRRAAADPVVSDDGSGHDCGSSRHGGAACSRTPDLAIAQFWLALLVFFDVVFVTLALWTFEPVMTD